MNFAEVKSALGTDSIRSMLQNDLAADPDAAAKRLFALIDRFRREYGERDDVSVYSISGRTELCGNHTDHNAGLVMAAAVNAELYAVVAPRRDGVIRVHSVGHREDVVPPERSNAPDPKRYFTAGALIAGMRRAFLDRGLPVCGFDAITESTVPSGSGLSSSAAFEVAIGTILSHLAAGGKVPATEIAKMAQEAENKFFGKPCGLMDQMACAVGGIIAIDFADAGKPVITPLSFSPRDEGYELVLTTTGGSHSDLQADYAAVPAEMKSVAALFGCRVLREVDPAKFHEALPTLRGKVSDRAILRAMHFFDENDRVRSLTAALEQPAGRMDAFLKTIRESGASSAALLQNIYAPGHPNEQGMTLALALSERLLAKRGGAWRVHGGGFAGAVQAFVPFDAVNEYVTEMERVFGKGACRRLSIRPAGCTRIL